VIRGGIMSVAQSTAHTNDDVAVRAIGADDGAHRTGLHRPGHLPSSGQQVVHEAQAAAAVGVLM
jgi:hypothetical protein